MANKKTDKDVIKKALERGKKTDAKASSKADNKAKPKTKTAAKKATASKSTNKVAKIDKNQKTVLHVGAGSSRQVAGDFADYKQVTLDIDKAAKPDIVGDMLDMNSVEEGAFNGVYSSHNLEHVYRHQVPQALGEFKRVLKDEGELIITMPDIQRVAQQVAAGNLEEPLYNSPAGPIAAIDILHGHSAFIAGGKTYMAHKTSFTAATLGQHLAAQRFYKIVVIRTGYNLWAYAVKPGKNVLLPDNIRFMTLDTGEYPFGAHVMEKGFKHQMQTSLKGAIDKTLQDNNMQQLMA